MRKFTLSDSVEYAFEVANTSDGWITTFRSAVRGVSFEMAAWKPAPRVASIWELTLHAANYVETLLSDLNRQPRIEHKDWPKAKPTQAEWLKLKKRLVASIDAVKERVSALSEEELLSPPEGLKTPLVKRILDIAIHDAYHAGQIIKLKQLYGAKG